MYIDTAYSTQAGKTYRRHLLRESFREGGKVKHRTIANLSHCSEEEIAALKLALRHKANLAQLGSIKDVTMQLGLAKILGHQRAGKLALWQVLARLLDQGSRLSAVRLAQRHAAADILGLDTCNEDHLYQNLAWLAANQEVIEQHLFRRRYGCAPPQLFLYDITSSYLEGVNNILAAFGCHRDGKQGKPQLVIGLLTGPEGAPVAVRVFAGHTQDPKTLAEQIRTLVQSFGVSQVTLVGDRGMLQMPQVQALEAHEFHYITAITKSQIRQLLKTGAFQMQLFDQAWAEVECEAVRYIWRRHPQRVVEMAQARQQKLEALTARLTAQQRYRQYYLSTGPPTPRAQSRIVNQGRNNVTPIPAPQESSGSHQKKLPKE